MATAVHGAAANARQDQPVLFRLAEIKIDFDSFERVRNFLHEALDDFVEVEGGSDALGGFLEANELRDS
jgi:hypothetical protein